MVAMSSTAAPTTTATAATTNGGNRNIGGGGEPVAAAAAVAAAAGAPPSSAGTTTTATTATATTAGAASAAAAPPSQSQSGARSPDADGGAAAAAVPVQAVAMKLIDLRLQPSTAIITAVSGEFTAPGKHELCLLKAGGTIELYRIVIVRDDDDDDDETSRTVLKLMTRLETRSILRSCAVVRFPGEKRDVIAVTADSGNVTVLDLEHGGGAAKRVHCVAFGKTACRRSTPGQYCAADPKGRAVMAAAVEKRKLVYVLNRDAAGNPTIASPLEAHRNRTITFAATALDNGYDNPIFATLELQYSDDAAAVSTKADAAAAATVPEKVLAYYELDLGLNHVSRTFASAVHSTACCLAAVPGGADGPGGVLIGAEDYIEYAHDKIAATAAKGNENDGSAAAMGGRIVAALPRRKNHPSKKGVLVTVLTVHRQKKFKFFALAQTELGDVYKVTVSLNDADKTAVTGMEVSLLDTLPAANALAVSKLGMLFCASEFGNHWLYKFERIDLPNAVTMNSQQTVEAYQKYHQQKRQQQQQQQQQHGHQQQQHVSQFLTTETAAAMASTFVPDHLQNLYKVCSLENPSPTSAVMVGELAGNEVSPQIYTLTGRGPTASIRIARHGASVTELAVSDLPGVPGGIFTVADHTAAGGTAAGGAAPPTATTPRSNRRCYDKYIVVSFANATLVLAVGDAGVEEVGRESGFVTESPTLACAALGWQGAVCQVHPAGVRHIQSGQAKQWHCPGLKRIECASTNHAQVLIALAGGEVIYFELDAVSGNLTQVCDRDMGADVCCLDVGVVRAGSRRSLFAAIGCRNQTVSVVSLEPKKKLEKLSYVATKSRPHSVALLPPPQRAVSGDGDDGDVAASASADDRLTLVIGLDDGSSNRAAVDPVTGNIGSPLTRRFLGARPVSVSRVLLGQQTATLLLSSRPWIMRRVDGGGGGSGGSSSGGGSAAVKYIMAPLSYAPLDHGCSFSSDAVREGVVACAGSTLRILSIDSQQAVASSAGGGGSATGGGGSTPQDEAFHTNTVALRYTPRQMTLLAAPAGNDGDDDDYRVNSNNHKNNSTKVVLAVVESDCNDYGLEEKRAMGFDPETAGRPGKSKRGDGAKGDAGGGDDMDVDSDDEDAAKKGDDDDNDDDEDDEEEDADEMLARQTVIRGPVPAGAGHWGSCVRLLDPTNNCQTVDCLEMSRNEAALCCCSVRFHSKNGEALLAVGTVTNLSFHPLKQNRSHVVLYRVVAGSRFQLLHKTAIDDGPVLAVAHFQGRLLVGIGKSLRLYEMGKRQLLRKTELRGLPSVVKCLQTAGDRVFCGDMMQSVQILRYDAASNRLQLLASDASPRPIVTQELLDWNTVAVADKFGNVSVLRLPRGAEGAAGAAAAAAAADASGQLRAALWDASRKRADAAPKLELLCQYHVGEVVTGMTRSSLVAGGAESLLYVTVTGRMGALVPAASRDDVDFYTQLESACAAAAARWTGRDPAQYRSYYAPAVHVVDGELCAAYAELTAAEQAAIAERLDRTPAEILKKLEDTRNGLL